MVRVQKRLGFVTSLGFAAAALVMMVSCADDLYTDCQLDVTSPDPAIATCGANDGPSRSCVIENSIDCDTGACGRYQGSDPFCTKVCADDGDCPAGRCVEFVFQSGRNFCVQDETAVE